MSLYKPIGENEKEQQVPPLRYAPVGMTHLLDIGGFYLNTSLGFGISVPKQMCHPDRSVAQWRDLLFLFVLT
jgi:hypothetical protein